MYGKKTLVIQRVAQDSSLADGQDLKTTRKAKQMRSTSFSALKAQAKDCLLIRN
jgi:hypothetical protein